MPAGRHEPDLIRRLLIETKANYVLIGALTFVVAAGAIVFGLFAARFATDQAWDRYEILFTESVVGLSDGSAVLYNGVNIGRVTDINLNPADIRQVLVTAEVDADVPIHIDTVATIRLTGLTGTAAIQLSGGSPDAPLLAPPDTGGLPRIEAVASPLTRLLESSEGIVVTANSVMTQLDTLLRDDNIRRVDAALAAIESFTRTLEGSDGDLERLLTAGARAGESLPALIERLDAAAGRFTTVVERVDRSLVDDLPALRERLESTLAHLESAAARIDTIMALNEDELGQLGGGLEEIRGLVRNLSDLVRRVQRDPAQFLVGGEQPEEYRPQ